MSFKQLWERLETIFQLFSAFTLFFVLIFLLIGYTIWSFDMGNWHILARMLHISASILFTVMLLMQWRKHP